MDIAESRRNGPQLSMRHDDDDDVLKPLLLASSMGQGNVTTAYIEGTV